MGGPENALAGAAWLGGVRGGVAWLGVAWRSVSGRDKVWRGVVLGCMV